MVTLAQKIQHLYPASTPITDWRVTDSGAGPVITFWNPALGEQPSQATLDAVTQAQIDSALVASLRAAAVNAIDNVRGELLKIMRAELAVLADEITRVWEAMPRAVTSITRSGTTATVTTMQQHGLTGSRQIGIAGAAVAAYNGAKTITVTGPSAFTFTVAGNPATPATGSIIFALNTAASPTGRTFQQAIDAIKARLNDGTAD